MNILEKARPENCFRCADGSVLGSVYELESKLCAISSEAFYHHVNSYRNDFHNWIRDVFQDYELANELLGAKTPSEAAATVRKHLRKALLAKEEIENAIQTITVAKAKEVKPGPAKAAPRKKQRKSKKKKGPRKAVTTVKVVKKNPNRSKAQVGSSRNSAIGGMRNRAGHDLRLRSPAEAGLAIGPSRRSDLGNRKLNKNSRSNRKKKRGKSAHKRTKKQVNRWLNWLKIVPEL